MPKFVIVGCSWHVSHKSWYFSEFTGTKEEAEKEALYLKGKNERTFNTCAFSVIHIRDDETIVRPPLLKGTKLTWLQRIKGVV